MKFDNTNRMSLTCKLRIRLDISFSSQLSLKISFEKIANRQQNSSRNILAKVYRMSKNLNIFSFAKTETIQNIQWVVLKYFFSSYIESTLNVVMVSTDLKIIFPATSQIFTLRLFQFPPNPDQIFRIPWTGTP